MSAAACSRWMKSSRNGRSASAGRDHLSALGRAGYEKVRVSGAARVAYIAGGDRHYARRPTHDPGRERLAVGGRRCSKRDFLASLQTPGAAWRAADCQRRPTGDQKAALQSRFRPACAGNAASFTWPSFTCWPTCRRAFPKTRPASALRAVFNAPNRAEADRLHWRHGDPEVPSRAAQACKRLAGRATCPKGLTVFDFPAGTSPATTSHEQHAGAAQSRRSNAAPAYRRLRCSPTKLPCSAWPLRC